MITSVDTNILIDLLESSNYYQVSFVALEKARKLGTIICCDVVLTEVSTGTTLSTDKLDEFLVDVGIQFVSMSQASCHQAANCWRQYRATGGSRSRISADFLIGGHAQCQADQLLTRDAGFYRNYFADLQVIEP